MRKLGVVLALLVLFGTLTVGTGTVKAVENEKMRVVFTLSESYDVQQAVQALNWTGATHQYDTSTWIMLDGQHIIVKSSDMWDLFKEPADSTIDSTDWKAEKIASDVLQTLIDAGVVSADTYFANVVAQSTYISSGNYVYIVHYYIKNGQKREYKVKLAYAKLFWRMQAHADWDHGQNVVNIYDYVNEDNTQDREYYYHGIDQPTHTREGELFVNTFDSYISNKSVAVYTESAQCYNHDSWMRFRLIFISDQDYSSIDGINGLTGVQGTEIIKINYSPPRYAVTFSLKDALTGESLSGVTVKEDGQVLGTLDDGGTLELTKGTHDLAFEKQGYWSVTKTIDVQGDTSVSVEMYPSSAAFKLENFPADISIPENTIYTLTFTLSPVDTSATYNTYLSLSGLSDVLEVRKDGSVVSPESGKYYLGDISGPTQVSIKFKAGAVGQHGFTITLTSNDAIMSQTYTTTKQVTYQVEPLPFSVQMPSEWQVGENQLRISESSGQSYLITAVLKDSSGNEVWSDSYAFSPYEAHTFTINVPSEGSYTLELTWNGQTAVYGITVNPAITLVTKTLTVQEGGEGTIVLHFKNPSSNVQYYTIKVSGGFLPAEINQSIAVAPYAEKDVSITFAVPEDLTYDAYELNVQVLQGDAVVFQDEVAVSVSGSSGFSLFGGGSNTPTWAYALLGLLILGGAILLLRRR